MSFLRSGELGRAEAIFYVATSLHEDSHAAHKGLALVSVLVGHWEEAAAHWKNTLFLATEQDSEYLQRLGSLLILSGRLNEGRHYLSRAVSQWELAQGPRGAYGKEIRVGPSEYSWFVQYLVGAGTALSWPPHGSYDGDVQTAHEWRLLAQLVDDPGLLHPVAFLELSDLLFDIGAYPESLLHLKHAQGLARENPALSLKLSLRSLLNRHPWLCERSPPTFQPFDQQPLQHFLDLPLSDTLTATDVLEFQTRLLTVTRQSSGGNQTDPSLFHRVLSAHHAALREDQPSNKRKPNKSSVSKHRSLIPLHIAVVVDGSSADTWLLKAMTSLVETFRVTVFTTQPLSESDRRGVEIEMLSSDWSNAASIIRDLAFDAVVFSDSCSAFVSLVASRRLATFQIVFGIGAHASPLAVTDFYLKPEYTPTLETRGHLVALSGIGVPWYTAHPVLEDPSPRYEFHGHVFFSRMSLILVASPFSEFTPSMDDWVVALLQADPQIHVVLLVDNADFQGRAYPSQWQHRYMQHVRTRLGGDRDAHSRLKLMPRLDQQQRLALMKISHAFLDSPRGGTATVLEALSVGTPVLTSGQQSSMARSLLQTLARSSDNPILDRLVFEDTKGLAEVTRALVSDEGRSAFRSALRKGCEHWENSTSGGSADFTTFFTNLLVGSPAPDNTEISKN